MAQAFVCCWGALLCGLVAMRAACMQERVADGGHTRIRLVCICLHYKIALVDACLHACMQSACMLASVRACVRVQANNVRKSARQIRDRMRSK
jgi:hypothetical protein